MKKEKSSAKKEKGMIIRISINKHNMLYNIQKNLEKVCLGRMFVA